MESEQKIITVLVIALLSVLIAGKNLEMNLKSKNIVSINQQTSQNVKDSNKIKESTKKKTTKEKTQTEEKKKEEKAQPTATPMPTEEPEVEEAVSESDPIVYDGLTMNELADKLNRSLNSTLAGKGSLFASYSLELGIDPYLAVAIVLHETGCQAECSYLVQYCNNVGGMKGSPSCNGGAYGAFATLDDGIRAFLNNLYRNYYADGLTTPETIGPRYAESTEWVANVNWYINSIRSR